MSTKMKINIILLITMFASTCYFLKAIDAQERIITTYQAQQQQIKNLKYYSGKPLDIDMEIRLANNGKLETDIRQEIFLNAKPIINSLYRYMIALDAFLILAIVVISKSFNKTQTKE